MSTLPKLRRGKERVPFGSVPQRNNRLYLDEIFQAKSTHVHSTLLGTLQNTFFIAAKRRSPNQQSNELAQFDFLEGFYGVKMSITRLLDR